MTAGDLDDVMAFDGGFDLGLDFGDAADVDVVEAFAGELGGGGFPVFGVVDVDLA